MSGLRERKKARTRADIRAQAMRLFREQGYAATTVDQIAEAAEVSQSTFFRYFPTKEDVVLDDDTDPLIFEAFRAMPPDMAPLAALRAALRQVNEAVPEIEHKTHGERLDLIAAVPELRARMLDELAGAVNLVAVLFAERTGRARDDVAVTTLAGAVIGIGIAAMAARNEDPSIDVIEHMDAGLAQLEAGVTL